MRPLALVPLALLVGCGRLPFVLEDAGEVEDAGVDAGLPDAGASDAGHVEELPDAGPLDAGAFDAGEPDAGEPDAGAPDAGPADAGAPDGGPPDASVPVRDGGGDGPPYPRTVNVYLQGYVDPSLIPALSKWDALVINTAWTRAQLQQLKQLNPRIRVFAYVCPYCTSAARPPIVTWEQTNWDYAEQNDLWWYRGDRSFATDWPSTRMIDLTSTGFSGPQGNWREYIAARVEALLDTTPELDGIFYDNFWKAVSWELPQIRTKSDCHPTRQPAGCDGGVDAPAELDSRWNPALRELARDTRERFDKLARPERPALITNGAGDYFSSLNGTMSEFFPQGSGAGDYGNAYGYNWIERMLNGPGGYLVAPFSQSPYGGSILNASLPGTFAMPTRTADFERVKRFTLVSALLGDGYYSLDNPPGHGAVWWEPEFDHAGRGKGYLGWPLGPAVRIASPTGPELVVNGTFSQNTSSWVGQTFSATGSWTTDTTDFASAPASARVDLQSVSANGSFKIYQVFSVVRDRAYTLSFKAKSSVEQDLLLHLYSNVCPSGRCLRDTRVHLSTGWEEHTVSFIANGTDAATGLNLFISTPGTVWLDDVSLREGDTNVFRRDFDHGVVILNYTSASRVIGLGGSFTRLSIPGSTVSDGQVVTQETVGPSDARILLR